MKYQTKDIKGYPGYRVDTNGDVWSCKKQRSTFGQHGGTESYLSNEWKKLKLYKNKKGYSIVTLTANNQNFPRRVHQLVAEVFISNPQNKPYVLHKNDIKDDNRVGNLKWGTPSENMLDKMKNDKCHKLKIKDVILIRRLSRDSNLTHQRISDLFKVSRSHISRIIKGSARTFELEIDLYSNVN